MTTITPAQQRTSSLQTVYLAKTRYRRNLYIIDECPDIEVEMRIVQYRHPEIQLSCFGNGCAAKDLYAILNHQRRSKNGERQFLLKNSTIDCIKRLIEDGDPKEERPFPWGEYEGYYPSEMTTRDQIEFMEKMLRDLRHHTFLKYQILQALKSSRRSLSNVPKIPK